MSSTLATYLHHLGEVRSSGGGVKETSFYPALSNLLNKIGQELPLRVRCVLQLSNQGAGYPDGGLFTLDQLGHDHEGEPLDGQLPARGVIEIKGTDEDIYALARSKQIKRYLDRYGLVLLTNYRDFLLVGREQDGSPRFAESYSLARSESEFWKAVRDPRLLDDLHSDTFVDYLRRVMLHGAPLTEPKDVAAFLASYAREAKSRIERRGLRGLSIVRSALEESLGLRFEGEKGDHFFHSTLVQTLFYGVFSAWVLWCKRRPVGDDAQFEWQTAIWTLRVPAINVLFQQIANPYTLEPLKLVEVLDWAGVVLNRVDRDAFFSRFEEAYAVQYFYEPFLQEFDPQLRKELGVWYTPPEIVP